MTTLRGSFTQVDGLKSGLMLATDDLEALAERDGWELTGRVATYRPWPTGWYARLDHRTVYGKYHQRWHVSLCDSRDRCREVAVRTTLADARRLAEGRVMGENGRGSDLFRSAHSH